MRSPRRTCELKSANSDCTRPDTWLPTSTVTTADRLPEALTRETTSPRASGSVVYRGASPLPELKRQSPPSTSTTSTSAQTRRERSSEPGFMQAPVGGGLQAAGGGTMSAASASTSERAAAARCATSPAEGT